VDQTYGQKNKLRLFVKILYILFLLIPLYVVLKNSGGPAGLIKMFSNPSLVAYLFLRLTGLYAFFLIFLQIVHGAFMPLWFKIFDSRSTVDHERNGIYAYLLILAHPTFFTLSAFLAEGTQGVIDAFIPGFFTQTDLLLNYGRIGFTLITLGVLAAYFRHKPFLNRHWLKSHVLNYVGFWFLFLHSWNIGSDTQTFPLNIIYPTMALIVGSSIVYRFIPRLYKVIRAARFKEGEQRV